MEKVLIGMSGGVDSSVSALLLKEKGYEVIGATMLLTDDKEKNDKIVEDARNVCKQIGISFYVFDFREEFRKNVICNFINCYKCAKTPNPCVECNKYMKFGKFAEKAEELGCKYISTGHYAKVEYSTKYSQYVLKRAGAQEKDQTYFLYAIPKQIIEKLIFPLENIEEKKDVRKIAEEKGLKIARKPDSQEICFIPNDDYANYLTKEITPQKGKIVLTDGTILGEHKGLIYYTVGQRKGLGISYVEPLYVIRLDKENNNVIVGTEKELYSTTLYAEELNFLLNIDLSKPLEVMAKVRYRAKLAEATLYPQVEGKVKVEFKNPQRAITPGQSVVFYIENILLGGGKISSNV